MEKTEKKSNNNQVYYSRGEEWFNIISHIAGAVLALAAAVLVIAKAGIHAHRGDYKHPATAVVSVCLFGGMLILLYLMSALYHSRRFGGRARAVFRKFDHCMVALLIAGTYAPYMLIGLVEKGIHQPSNMIWGIVIASVILGTAVLAVIFNSVNVHKFRYFGMASYVLMGWCCIIQIYELYTAIHFWSFFFLLAGGIMYTVGIIFYSIKKIRFNHAIWHLFVVAGSTLHFVSIFFFML